MGRVRQCSTLATELLAHLAFSDEVKGGIRDAGGILALLRQLQLEQQDPAVLETVLRSLTMLVISNAANQDYIRCVRARAPPGCSARKGT
jgi:hypothetical protein